MSFDKAKGHFLAGLSLMSSERWADAEFEFRQSLNLLPGRLSTLINLSASLLKQDKLSEAECFVEEALALEQDNPEALLNHGILCFKMGRASEGEESFLSALAVRPDSAEILTNLGSLVIEEGRVEEALGYYKRAMELHPDYPEALNSYGVALTGLMHYEEALAYFDRSVELRPTFYEAWNNRGGVLHDLQRYDESYQSYTTALKVRPGYSEALYNQGLLLLSLKSFESGFELYKHRWSSKPPPRRELTLDLPAWHRDNLPRSGSDPARVLLWAEQGLGDEVFYASLLRLLPDSGLLFSLSVDHRLMPIFSRSFPGMDLIDRRLVPRLEDGQFDAQAPIGDLGGILEISERRATDIASSPYLIPNRQVGGRLREENPGFREGPICGVAWRSSGGRFSSQKSLDLESFGRALRALPHQLVNLQYGDVGGDLLVLEKTASREIRQARGLDIYNDIEGLTSLIDLCDVVVTCSNVTAHLAGAIGKRCAVLLPFGRGKIWYWHEGDKTSMWYPSLRLFRQDRDLDWTPPIREACGWISNLGRTSERSN